MRYRNPHPHTVLLPEHQDGDGQLYPAVAVEPGEALDWPIPIAGFEPAGPGRPAKKAPAPAEAETNQPTAKSAPAKGAAA